MATLDDILTAQKNGVIAINNISKVYAYIGGQITSQTYSYSNGTTAIYSGAGRLVNFIVTVPSTSIAVAGASWAAGVATITHTGGVFTVGALVTISSVNPSGYNGTFAIASSSAGQFTYALTANPGAYVSGGSFAVNGTIYNAPTSSSVLITANNIIASIPGTVGVTPVGAHFSNGLVFAPGTGQSANITYSVD